MAMEVTLSEGPGFMREDTCSPDKGAMLATIGKTQQYYTANEGDSCMEKLFPYKIPMGRHLAVRHNLFPWDFILQ